MSSERVDLLTGLPQGVRKPKLAPKSRHKENRVDAALREARAILMRQRARIEEEYDRTQTAIEALEHFSPDRAVV